MSRLRILTLPVLLLVAAALSGQKKFELTIENIMRGPGLVGYEPSSIHWSGSSDKIFFQWKQASDPLHAPLDTYVANRDGSGVKKLSEEEAKLAPPASGDESPDKSKIVYAQDGDLFVYDRTTDQRRRLTQTGDVESDPHFLRDGKRISFVRSNNLYVMPLEGGLLLQLTDIRAAGAGATPATPAGGRGQGGRGGAAASADDEKKGTDSQEFLKKEEKDLLEAVKERAKRREEEEAKKKRENPRKPFTLQARQSVTRLVLAPDEKYVVATISEQAEGSKNTVVPNFVTESAYTEDIPSRNKVGDLQARQRIALLNVTTGEAKFVEHGFKEKKGDKETDREVQVGAPVFSEDGKRAVMNARSADNKDRWILALDEATAKTRVLATMHDDAWIGGLGMFTLGWLAGDGEIYYQSEQTGFSHLYAVPWEGGEPRALTSGKFEVLSAELSKDRNLFYLTTSEAGATEHQISVMAAGGGPRRQLTRTPGHHRGVLSPDEKWIADLYSYANKPPELYVMENRVDAPEAKLTASPAPDFAQYPWLDVPIVGVPARDGVKVPAHLYKPANFKKGGPAVVFVHGAGYLQNIHKGWSSYYHEYMFHHFLMEHGYLVIDLDYRGSAGYGRDWRTAIYRHMGGQDLDDQVDAVKWLVKEHGVDPKKVGLYGGSYGGFITLMALFTQPDVFAAGAALRPVTDWAHYNHGYTSNILNPPQKDAEAYRVSSPIYFAQNLKGSLLICHGMVDTNVHFQDTVRLVQRLIELKKDNWELAVFPVEDHGFVEPTSWTDEYKRIFRLFETKLK